MAKKETTPSFSDFEAENLLSTEAELEQEETQEEEQEQEENSEEEKPAKPEKKVKKVAPKAKKVEVEETEEEEEQEEEVVETKVKEDKANETKDVLEEEEEQPSVDDAETFYQEVEKLTGLELQVDYGDVDPLSPQGVALRESAVKEAALESFLEEIETKYPQAFKALKYAYNGGDIAELFSQTLNRDYSKVVLNEGDDALAKEILKEYYKSRGVKNEAKIAKMIAADEESESGLVTEARTALEELKGEQEEARNKVIEEQERKQAESRKKDQIFLTAVDEVLDKRALGSFKIPDRAEATQFRQFVMSNIRKTGDGKYELATPVDGSNLEKILQYQYFQYKKGDLSKIIQQKVGSATAERVKLRLAAEQSKTKKNTTQEDKENQKLSLRSYEV